MVEVVAETMVTLGMNLDEPAVPDAGEHPRAISHMVGPGRWFHVSVGPPDRSCGFWSLAKVGVVVSSRVRRCQDMFGPLKIGKMCEGTSGVHHHCLDG